MGAGPSSRLRVLDADPIGQGAFSTVYRGVLDSERSVAVKRLHFRVEGDYSREAAVLSVLKHDNIIGYYGQFPNAGGTYDLVFELACGITLAGALHRRNLSTTWKRSTIYQISCGVAYLHALGILHLDLKPPNILFRDHNLERVLICDFGMATQASVSRHAGARKFRAPDSPYTQKSDVFSLASIACCIFAGRNPETPGETAEIISSVLRDHASELNRSWRLALERGVDRRAQVRPTAQQFRDTFERSGSDLWQGICDLISAIKRFFIILFLTYLFCIFITGKQEAHGGKP